MNQQLRIHIPCEKQEFGLRDDTTSNLCDAKRKYTEFTSPHKSDVDRTAHGIPHRVVRLKCIGNSVVPQCVKVIGEFIIKSGLFNN